MKNRAARKEVNKEKLVFNLENIRRVIQENIVKPQIKTSLDQVTNKSVYWDIRVNYIQLYISFKIKSHFYCCRELITI